MNQETLINKLIELREKNDLFGFCTKGDEVDQIISEMETAVFSRSKTKRVTISEKIDDQVQMLQIYLLEMHQYKADIEYQRVIANQIYFLEKLNTGQL
jgi:hypothetical protein